MEAETTGNLQVCSSRVMLDGEPRTATLDIVDGVVAAIDVGQPPAAAHDLGDQVLSPAPLDLHIHGCAGITVPPAGDPLALDAALAGALAAAPGFAPASSEARGLLPAPRTGWLATLPVPSRPVPDQVEHVGAAARAIAAAGEATGCAGIRIEGCFLNPDRAGIWPPETFSLPDVRLLDALVDAAAAGGSALRVIDVAPELPGAIRLIERAVERGVVVSLAHTDATWDEAVQAIDAGATLATHTWNAMRPVVHRDPGVVAAVLADARVTCELVCDGVHLHPGTVELSIAACGRGRWALITDASPLAGLSPGTYPWAGTTITHDGTALRDHRGALAGSALLLPAALEQLAALPARAGVDGFEAALAASATPRRVLDPSRPLGLVVGDRVWAAPPGRSPDEANPTT